MPRRSEEAQILRGEGEGERTRILNDAFGKDLNSLRFTGLWRLTMRRLAMAPQMVLSPDSEFFGFSMTCRGDSSRGRSSIDK